MNFYTLYDTATGDILGKMSTSGKPTPPRPGIGIIPGVFSRDDYTVVDGSAVLK